MKGKKLVKIITRGLQVDEMGAEVDELTRDRGNSILVHGLPVQQVECSFMSNMHIMAILSDRRSVSRVW